MTIGGHVLDAVIQTKMINVFSVAFTLLVPKPTSAI